MKRPSGAPLQDRLLALPANIRLARDKHSSLLRKFLNYGRKEFYNIGSGNIKPFNAVNNLTWQRASVCHCQPLPPGLKFPWRHDPQHIDIRPNDTQKKDLFATLRINDNQHKWHTVLCHNTECCYAGCHYAEFCHAECHGAISYKAKTAAPLPCPQTLGQSIKTVSVKYTSSLWYKMKKFIVQAPKACTIKIL